MAGSCEIWGSQSSVAEGQDFCVVGRVVPDVSSWTAWPWRWRHYSPLKHLELLMQRHSLTSQKGNLLAVPYWYLHAKLHVSDGVTSNLIDLNCEVAPPPMPLPRREHEYVNDIVISNNRDVFDMREYHSASFVMASDSSIQRANSLCLCSRAIQHCCSNWHSCSCFPEGAAATGSLVPWPCESAGGWNLADTGKLFACVFWNVTLCSLVFVKLHNMTFCKP